MKCLSRFLFLIVILMAHSLSAETPANAVPPGPNRVSFAGSIKIVSAPESQNAFGPSSAVIGRTELTQAEGDSTQEFSVALKMRNFAELQSRIAKGETIPLDEIVDKYYPTPADYDKIAGWLLEQGFTLKSADKYALSVFARGSVAQIQNAFQTKLGRVNFAGVESNSALTAPSLPAGVALPVLGINGLQPHLHPRSHSARRPVGPGTLINGGPGKLINNMPPYTVPEMAKAYNANALGVNGSGQKIGIVIDTFPANGDLTQFWAANGVNQSLANIEKIQVVSGPLPSPSGEESLDVEWSSGIASGAGVRVYATTDLGFGHLDQAYQAIINDLPSQPGLRQISLSYGLGELYESANQIETDDQYFATLAAAGVSVFVSSGDGGSSPGLNGFEDNSGPVQVESPANDPNVTAVGGTTLQLSGSGAVSSEIAWSFGGGGSSQVFARPAWQNGAGVPSGTFRLVPDVALNADLNTGGYLVLNGQVYIVGGTSWGAPTWAGICATINQARASVGAPSLGLLNPKIYPLNSTANFRGIVVGSNGPNGVYNAGPGYNRCTGIGVPSVASLVQALTPSSPQWHLAGAADFLGNGQADFVWEDTVTGQHVIWILNKGVYSSSINLDTIQPSWRIAGEGDFLGNGQASLVWENTVTGQHVIWILNKGVYSYSINLDTIQPSWRIAGAGDFLGNGQASLVWENTGTGQHVIWILNKGVYSYSIGLDTVQPSWRIAAAADFLGNGQASLVWENTVTGQHVIWILSKGVYSYSISLDTIQPSWRIAGAADFLGNGQASLVWEDTVTGQHVIWILNKGVYTYSIDVPTVY
jgi:kumamolisin